MKKIVCFLKLLCGETVPWAFGSTCRKMGNEGFPLFQHCYCGRRSNNSNHCLCQVCNLLYLVSTWLCIQLLLHFTTHRIKSYFYIWRLRSRLHFFVNSRFDRKKSTDCVFSCCSSAYYLNPHLNKRTWALIFGAASLSVDLLPTLHNFRIFSFVGALTTTYTSWYMLTTALTHGQVDLLILLFHQFLARYLKHSQGFNCQTNACS